PLAMAVTTSSGDIWQAFRRSGSTRITMVRWFPPKGGGAETPGRLANMGRTAKRALSWIAAMLLLLSKTRQPTGRLPASKRMMKGGTVFGGMKERERFT